jgi:hypothetical protein
MGAVVRRASNGSLTVLRLKGWLPVDRGPSFNQGPQRPQTAVFGR